MRNVLLLAIILVISVGAHAQTQRDELDKQSYEMYQQVFSPFCPGRSLNDCPSSKAQDLKAEMRSKLEQGVSKEQILQDVFARFGDKYRAVPLFEGIGQLVWLAPIAFLGIGFLLAMRVILSRKKSESGPTRASQLSVSSDLERQVEQELSKLD